MPSDVLRGEANLGSWCGEHTAAAGKGSGRAQTPRGSRPVTPPGTVAAAVSEAPQPVLSALQ